MTGSPLREKNLELNLGKACNNRCIFCLDGNAPASSRRWLPVARAREEMRVARARGVASIGLLGGEPTAHPKIVELAAEARELGFTRVALATNGLKLADAAFARELALAGVTRVGVSIHGHRAAVEDHLSGRKGNFARKLRAIENLLALRAGGLLPHNVSLNAVITRAGFRHMGAFAAFFARRGIGDVRFNLVRTDACPERGIELTPRLAELAPEILKTAVVNEKLLSIDLGFGDVPFCAYPAPVRADPRLRARYVGEHRDLDTSCAVFVAPADARAPAQRFRWSERKRGALKVRGEACRACAAAAACEGVWRSYAGLYGTGELAPLGAGWEDA